MKSHLDLCFFSEQKLESLGDIFRLHGLYDRIIYKGIKCKLYWVFNCQKGLPYNNRDYRVYDIRRKDSKWLEYNIMSRIYNLKCKRGNLLESWKYLIVSKASHDMILEEFQAFLQSTSKYCENVASTI